MSILLQVSRRVVHFVLGFRNNHCCRTDADRPISSESESGNWLIWSHCWSVWLVLSKVRTLQGLLCRGNTIQYAWRPTPNPRSAGSSPVCLVSEEPIALQGTALPLFHWMSLPWPADHIMYPSNGWVEDEEVEAVRRYECWGFRLADRGLIWQRGWWVHK